MVINKMIKSTTTIFAVVMLWSCGEYLQAQDLLLSGNTESPLFPKTERRMGSGAELSWVTDGEYKSNAELVKTGSRPDGKRRVLLDGRVGSDGDCQAFGVWSGGVYYGSFIIDLKNKYLITRTAVWSQQTETQAMESFEVLLSDDGNKFISMGSCTVDPQLKSGKDRLGVRSEYKLPNPAVAQYVMIRARKKGGSRQMVLCEAAIWGRNSTSGMGVEMRPENQRPGVVFTVAGIQSGAVMLDWRGFAQNGDKVKKWRIYEGEEPFKKISDRGVKLREVLDAKITRKALYPLAPGKRYFFGITAEYEDGECGAVNAASYTPPMPFTCEKFSDMPAINHYWGGGSARMVKRPHGGEWEQVALDLLAQTPFKETRWWRSYPEIVGKFYEHGIGICVFPSEENYKNGRQLGIYEYSAGNEPELSGKPLNDYVERLKGNYKQGKAIDRFNTISAPTSNLDDHALEWLDRFYAAGAKEYFDVLDLHTYLKSSGGFKGPAGYENSAPEALLERMERVNAIKAKYGDSAKPVISTEFGYTECRSGNPSGNITPEKKAQYLVRGLILHYVLGFKRVYVYSFWDEGDDANYTEHAFGMVDYNMQKKPAFTAVCVLGRELGEATELTPIEGMKIPHFGYTATMRKNPETVSVIWDGSGSYSGVFTTTSGKVKVVTMAGEVRQMHTDTEGKFRLIFDGSPLYIHTAGPMRMLSSRKVEKTEKRAEGIELRLAREVFTMRTENKQVNIGFTLLNGSRGKQGVDIRLDDSEGKNIAVKHMEVNGGEEISGSFSLPAPEQILEKYRISISYSNQVSSFADEKSFYVRRLQPNNDKVNVLTGRMTGWGKPVICLSNNSLEVTIDPSRGGRVLEILNKSTGANQVNLPYEKLGGLSSISYAYCIWDEVKSERGFAISSKAVYRTEEIANGVVLRGGEAGKLDITKTYTLDPVQAELKLKVKIVNNSNRELPVTYYLHPEYTVGGAAESNNDIIMLPIAGQTLKLPFWNGLGEKRTDKLDKGWWAIADEAGGLELRQEFEINQFKNPRLWFGIGCYNLEMESIEGLKLKPGESWQGMLSWQLKQRKM